MRPMCRHGVAVVALLACLAVAAVLLAVIVRNIAASRRALDDRASRLQAEWLAESACDRAAARLRKDSDFAGEMWTVGTDQFDGTAGGVATIAVAAAGEPSQRRVTVAAEYPANSVSRARYEKEIIIELTERKGERP